MEFKADDGPETEAERLERERAVNEIKRWSWRDDECWIGDALVAIVAGQAKYEDLPYCALQYDGEIKPKDSNVGKIVKWAWPQMWPRFLSFKFLGTRAAVSECVI